jgi:hypothetical protein
VTAVGSLKVTPSSLTGLAKEVCATKQKIKMIAVELISFLLSSPFIQGEFNSQVQLYLSVRGQAAVASVACL